MRLIFFKIIFFFIFFSWINVSYSVEVLGTGTAALIGGDLTDPEDDGVDGANTNWNWTSISASSEEKWTSEGSFNVFDNKVGATNNKWCCNGPTQWISVGFSQPYILSHFTITSGNDVTSRDPDIWKIQGSNDGDNWTDIFVYDNNGVSPWGTTRLRVLKYTGNGDDFSTPNAFSYFRYYVTSTGSSAHQINELEYFGSADSTNPTLILSVPPDNATGVAEDANIVLTFDEIVDAETGNITIKKTSDNSTVETIDVTGGQLSGSGSTQITLDPSVTLDSSTEYYVLIDATAFDDVSGNSYAGISSTTALSFTTGDTTGPTLTSSVPADNATSVAVDSTIVLNFSESVDAESGNITIKKTSDNSTVETIDVTGGQVTGSGTSQITVTPSSDFDASTEYYVLIDATAFDDSESGSYAGISSTTALSFTTESTASDPFEDKTVVALVEAQTDVQNRILQNVSTPIFNRLQWLRNYNEDRELFSQGIKFRFSNPILASISKVVPVALTDDEEIEEEEIDTTWSFWSEGSVSIGKVGDTTSSHSKDINTTGITIGLDNKVSDRYLYGYTIRYTKDDVDVGTPGTSLDTNAYSLSTYASFLTGESKFIEGIFGFSKLDLKNVRKSGSNTLYGDRDGTQLYGSINYSTVLNRNNLNISPNIRLDISQTYLKEYSETGTDALSYDDQTIKNGALYSGVNLNNVFKFNNINLIPNAGIELGLDFSPSSDASITYVSDPNTSYMRSIDQQKSKSGKVKLGLDIITNTGFSLSTLYERNQSENSHSDTFYLGTAYITLKEAQYALSIKDNVASADYGKKLNGFDILIETDYDLFSEYPEYAINLKISSIF